MRPVLRTCQETVLKDYAGNKLFHTLCIFTYLRFKAGAPEIPNTVECFHLIWMFYLARFSPHHVLQ